MIGSFLTVGEQVLILFALMAVGFALGKAKLMGDKGSLAMTNLVMYARHDGGGLPAGEGHGGSA